VACSPVISASGVQAFSVKLKLKHAIFYNDGEAEILEAKKEEWKLNGDDCKID